MKKWIAFVLVLVFVLSFTGCGKNTTKKIKITIPAGSQEPFVYSDEAISPIGRKITISSGEELGETQVILKTVNEALTPGYVATDLIPGTPVVFDTEKGELLKIGISVQNPTDQDITVYLEVKGIESY